MIKERTHVTISFPRDLKEEIEGMINKNELVGYRNHTEFIIESARINLRNVKKELREEKARKDHEEILNAR